MDEVKSIAKLSAALQIAQLEFEPIIRDAQNPAFKRNGKISTYATLKSVIIAVRETLKKHGLVIIQKNIFREGMFGVASKLVHLESGEEYASEFLAPIDKQSAQGVASCLTYARRSEYMTLLGLTPEDDDDGNAASGINQNPQNGQQEQQSSKLMPGRPKGRPKQAVKTPTEAITAPPAAQTEAPAPESPKTEENAPEAPETPKEANVTNLPNKEELQEFYRRAKIVSAKLGEAGLAEPGPKLVKFITVVAGVQSMPAIDKIKFEAIVSKLEETSQKHPIGLIQTIEERIK